MSVKERSRPYTVLLVGPRADSRGGVAATVRGITHSRLSDRYHLIAVATFRDGSMFAKLSQLVRGVVLVVRLTRRRDVAIVHIHASTGVSFLRKAVVHALVRRRSIPVIFHLHPGPMRLDLERRGIRGALTRRALCWSLARADVVVALSEGWAEALRALAPISRLTVVPNAPDLVAPISRNSRCGSGPEQLLFLGHLYREKGVFELLDAFERLRKERPGIQLTMAGVGTEEKAIVHAAAARGIRNSLRLTGWVSPQTKNELLASADCLVLPSYEEGLPLALLEAMTAGVPVVATPVGGVAEVARHEVEALLVPPRDPFALAHAIERILGDRALAKRLVGAARERAEEFSPDAQAQRIGALYDELVSAG